MSDVETGWREDARRAMADEDSSKDPSQNPGEDPGIAAARRWYAEDLRLRAPVRRNLAIVEAFAAVPRERFLGEPPWRIIPDALPRDPVAAPDASARWVYHDVLVAIDPARKLNNGMPSLW